MGFEYCSLSKRFVTNGTSVGTNVIMRLFMSYDMRNVSKIFATSSKLVKQN